VQKRVVGIYQRLLMHSRKDYVIVCVFRNERFVVVPLKGSKGTDIWGQP